MTHEHTGHTEHTEHTGQAELDQQAEPSPVNSTQGFGVEVNETNPLLSRFEGSSPVMQVVLDMLKRGAIVAPVMIGLGWLIWGSATSVAFGLALIFVNFFLSAWIIQVTARISFAALAGGAMFGFLIRLGIVTVAVLLVRNADWIDLVALGVTIIITHHGLLFWELRYISGSLAYPGLKPGKGRADTPTKESVSS